MAETIGSEHGITEQEVKEIKPRAVQFINKLKEERAAGKLPFLDLPYDRKTAMQILEAANSLRGKFKTLRLWVSAVRR